MPLKVCVPCERLFLFDEDTASTCVDCPYCARAVSQPAFRSMQEIPRFRLELVGRRVSHPEVPEMPTQLPA